MSPSLLLSQSRLSLPIHHMTWDIWTASHADGLAIFSLACPDLVADQSLRLKHLQITQICITAKTTQAQYSGHIHTHSWFFYISHQRVEEATGPESFCWAHLQLHITTIGAIIVITIDFTIKTLPSQQPSSSKYWNPVNMEWICRFSVVLETPNLANILTFALISVTHFLPLKEMSHQFEFG